MIEQPAQHRVQLQGAAEFAGDGQHDLQFVGRVIREEARIGRGGVYLGADDRIGGRRRRAWSAWSGSIRADAQFVVFRKRARPAMRTPLT